MRKYLIITVLCFWGINRSFSQEIDTAKIVLEIREKFSLIYNHEIEGMKKSSYTPESNSQEGQSEIVTGSAYMLEFYYKDSNIYFIREYNMSDEGGPLTFSSHISETYLLNNEPFFFYQKDFLGDSYDEETGNPIYGLKETRKYIYNGKIVKELTKYTKKGGMWLYEKELLENVKTDSVPNIDMSVKKNRNKFYWNSDLINKCLKIIEEDKNAG